MEYYIIVFQNTYGVMSAEKKLNEMNFAIRIMPTPTTITMSCGMCIRIEEKSIIEDIIKNNVIEYKNIYKRDQNGYIMIEE